MSKKHVFDVINSIVSSIVDDFFEWMRLVYMTEDMWRTNNPNVAEARREADAAEFKFWADCDRVHLNHRVMKAIIKSWMHHRMPWVISGYKWDIYSMNSWELNRLFWFKNKLMMHVYTIVKRGD